MFSGSAMALQVQYITEEFVCNTIKRERQECVNKNRGVSEEQLADGAKNKVKNLENKIKAKQETLNAVHKQFEQMKSDYRDMVRPLREDIDKMDNEIKAIKKRFPAVFPTQSIGNIPKGFGGTSSSFLP